MKGFKVVDADRSTSTPPPWHTNSRSGRRGHLISALALAAFGAVGANEAIATDVAVPVVVTTCSTCSSLASLQSTALAYFIANRGHTPPGFVPGVKYPGTTGYGFIFVMGDNELFSGSKGTHVRVISTAYAISADFHFVLGSGLHPSWTAVPLDVTTDADTRTVDARIFARAPQVPPIKLPSTYSPSDEDEVLGAYVASQLSASSAPKMDFWHGLTNFGQFYHLTLVDAQTGNSYDVYIGDTITVQFSDGSTEKFQYLGPFGSIQWKPVSGTLRDANGNDPTKPPPSPAPQAVNGAEQSVSWVVDNTLTFITVIPEENTGPTGVIIIETIPDEGGGGGTWQIPALELDD